ncbi:unnamed protein product, partial [Rotaria magnacalcarata]
TGGATIGLNPDRDSNATAAFAIRNLFPKQTLLGITGSGTINRTFAIDANISRMQIDLTSSRSVLPSTSNSLHLIGPDGVSITPVLTADGTYFQLYTIENPQAGLWQISSSQSFSRTIEITIPETSNASTLTICRTVLSQPIKRESNNSYGPLLTAPTVNQSDLVIVTSCQNLRSSIQSATVELVNKVGQIISVSHASNVTETGPIIFPVLIPNTDFRMLITIKLTDGSIVQRQSDALISPTSILISITNQPYTFKNNSMIPIAFTISNQAQETLTIHMCVLDTL